MVSIEEMGRMAPEKRKAKISEIKTRCICPKCQTYTECAAERNEKAFCFFGKTPDCISRALKCQCISCPVHSEMSLKGVHYCTKGAEKMDTRR